MSVSLEIIRGNLGALRELYQFKTNFLGYARKNFGAGIEDATDVFQESIIVFYKNVLKKNEVILNEKTYLFEIGKNILRNESRKEKNKFSVSVDDPFLQLTDNEEEYSFSDEQLQNGVTAMYKLGEPCSRLLHLFYFVEMSTESISNEMGYSSTDTVKAQKYKCMKRLKEIYSNTLGNQ